MSSKRKRTEAPWTDKEISAARPQDGRSSPEAIAKRRKTRLANLRKKMKGRAQRAPRAKAANGIGVAAAITHLETIERILASGKAPDVQELRLENLLALNSLRAV